MSFVQINLKLYKGRDDALIAALQALPAGQRMSRIRVVLEREFVQAPDLATAINRLAAAIERSPVKSKPDPDPPDHQPEPDHERKAKLRASVLGPFS